MDRDLFMFYKSALEGKFTTPLCSEYKSAWRKCGDDKEMLVKLALKQQSIPYLSHACYKELGLTKEYIKENFKDYISGRVLNDCDGVNGYTYALYVDWDYENDLEINTDVASIMWTVGANIIVSNTKCPTIYVSNRSNVHLVCEGYNSVRIYLFDKSTVTLEDVDEDSNIIIYKYSDDAKVEIGKYCLSKKIREFRKSLRL